MRHEMRVLGRVCGVWKRGRRFAGAVTKRAARQIICVGNMRMDSYCLRQVFEMLSHGLDALVDLVPVTNQRNAHLLELSVFETGHLP